MSLYGSKPSHHHPALDKFVMMLGSFDGGTLDTPGLKMFHIKMRVMYGDGIRRMEPRHFTDTVGSTEFSLLRAGLSYIDIIGR